MSAPVGDYTETLPRKRMGSGVLFTDDGGRILIVEPTYKDYWEIPGGVVDEDESPYGAAVRELTEELGLSVVPGRLLVADWVAPRAGRGDGLMFVYDGGRLDQAMLNQIRLPAEELRSWALCSMDEADRRLSDLLARRARAALRAKAEGVMFYLENGSVLI